MATDRAHLLTAGQASLMLGCEPKHIRRLIHAGQLDAVDVSLRHNGTSFRITQDSIEKFIEKRMVLKPVPMRAKSRTRKSDVRTGPDLAALAKQMFG